MKTKLVAKLRKEHADRAALHQQQAQTYATLVQEWHRKVEKLESTQKRKTKEAKNREFFEKIFPELRKQREDKERFNRVGARIKSEADLEEIMDGLQEQEVHNLFIKLSFLFLRFVIATKLFFLNMGSFVYCKYFCIVLSRKRRGEQKLNITNCVLL